jgi:hypothetical protein
MLVRFADAFNAIRNSKLLSEQSTRTMLTRPPGALGLDHGRPAQPIMVAVGMSVRSTNGRARRCAVTPVVAHHVQGQATQGRDLSTLRTFMDTSGSCA